MSKPTERELANLKREGSDSASYHVEFDALLEAKLMELDLEWMLAMDEQYKDSGCKRWFA